jgi:hypothetical protein
VTVIASAAAEESGVATLEDSDRTRADHVFREGRELLKQGRYEEACPKLEESQKLDGALGTLLNLGVCYEEWGKLASARRVYQEVVTQARELGQSDREALALERLAAVELAMAHVVLEFEGGQPASVSLDGVPLTDEDWNRPLPVDPGNHELTVRSVGKRLWSRRIEVTRSQQVKLVVPLLDPRPSAASPDRRPAVAAASAERPPVESRRAEDRAPVPTAALVLGGVSAAAAVVGGVFGILASSTNASSDDECGPKNACTQEGIELREKAFDQASISTIAFGVAAAGAAGALTLWLTEPSPRKSGAAVRFGGMASPSHIELGAGVAW